LPTANQAVLEWLILLLAQVISYADINLMGIDNIVLIFCATLSCSQELVRVLVLECQQIFSRDEDEAEYGEAEEEYGEYDDAEAGACDDAA
jgi:hypothetical protein